MPNINDLLREKSQITGQLNSMLYGSIELREKDKKQYIYVHFRQDGVLNTKYGGEYSDVLYNLIRNNTEIAKNLKRRLKEINKTLKELNYVQIDSVDEKVAINIDLARRYLVDSIYKQAMLEGVATTYSDTETIVNGGKVKDMTATDISKVVNLKHAWEFIMDKDVVASKSSYSILCYIAGLVNEGFYTYGGRIRCVPVTIGGTSYIPPMPIEFVVKEKIEEILNKNEEPVDIAIELCLYCMKTQIFNDGNKRASVIFANHFLISNGEGLLVIPENKVPEFKKMLVAYYEDRDNGEIFEFMKKYCWKKFW